MEPDLHLAVPAVESGERVAVGDRDDLEGELVGQGGAGQGEEEGVRMISAADVPDPAGRNADAIRSADTCFFPI